MPGAGKGETLKDLKKSLHMKNGIERSPTKKPKSKSNSHGTAIDSAMSEKKKVSCEGKGMRKDSTKKLIKKALHKSKSSRKQLSPNCQGASNEKGKHPTVDVRSQKLKQRKKRKRAKNNVEHDEAARLQRRTTYLLIKMKLEQNLLDAYAGEGWKGQSREKIKPEKELQRAKKQILKCKLGIRDAIRQLDTLGSVGCIDDSAIAPDGSVYHEHIVCAKCKLREAFPDNDILLCDGTCNCAFHQKCLDPPLLTENIPLGDQGWFCKFCECKTEILEAMNAHLGTNFSVDSYWKDIFKKEAALPDGGDSFLHPEREWPSDDSEDDDYDPEKCENSCSYSRTGSEDDASEAANSCSSLWSLEGEVFSESGRLEETGPSLTHKKNISHKKHNTQRNQQIRNGVYVCSSSL